MSTSSGMRNCYVTMSKLMAVALLWALPVVSNQAQAQSLEYVVFSIDGKIEGLALGQVLLEGHKFEVPENTNISLISKNGEIVSVQGPAIATVTKDDDNEIGEEALSTISARLFDENRFIQVAGATRSTGNETDLEVYLSGQKDDDAWVPVLSNADTYCIQEGSKVLRRTKAGNELTLKVGDRKPVVWNTGSNLLNLEDQIGPNQSENPIEISIGPRKVQLFVHYGDLPPLTSQLSWMAEMGCEHQALKLLASEVSKPGR